MSIRVATLNIWQKDGPWPARRPLIMSELARLGADVVGFQEVLRHRSDAPSPVTCQAWDLAQGTFPHVAYGAASDHGDGVTFGNAILSRYPILEQEVVPLPGQESGETRCLLHALVDHPAGELPVFVTHLNWKPTHGEIRLRQVVAIADAIDRLAPLGSTAQPPVLTGDFNAEDRSDEIRFLTGHHGVNGRRVFFADAWRFGLGKGDGATWDPANRFAARHPTPPLRIDYIFVRGDQLKVAGAPRNARLAFNDPTLVDGEAVWCSDHYGLVADLEVPGQ